MEAKRMTKAVLFLLFFLPGALLSPFRSEAGEAPVYSLEECIQKALEFSPKLKELQQEVEMAKARLAEAKGYQWPQLEVLALTGPAPKARGNQIESPHRNDRIHGLGIFGSIEIKAVQPIYTFGKITEAKKAAAHGIEVDRSRLIQKAADIAVEIKKYYYGHLAALEGKRLVNEIEGYLDRTIERTKRLLEQGSEHASELDLYKLEAFQGMLATYREKAEKNIALSKEALRTFMGLGKDADFRLKETSLRPVEVKIGDLDFYARKSRELRPEFTQLREGIAAKRALVEFERADYYPKVFAMAFYSFSEATERDRVTNPWIYDYFRHRFGGVVLGLKWNLDFGITRARVDMARAEQLKYERLRDYAEVGIPLQVEKTYRELMEAKRNIEATERAYKSARKWMVGAVMNYDMGIGEARDAGDAIVAYGKIKEDYIMAVYNFNLGYANLLQSAGLSVKDVAGRF